jgi:hypothetical protein
LEKAADKVGDKIDSAVEKANKELAPMQQQMEEGMDKAINKAKNAASEVIAELRSPVYIDIHSKSITNPFGVVYEYFVPNPVKLRFCCGYPCPGPCGQDPEMRDKGFFMELRSTKSKDRFKFQEVLKSCCGIPCCQSNSNQKLVEVIKNGKHIGHLEKPVRYCEPCCAACDECGGQEIIMMSFIKGYDDKAKEVYTLRKKGQGCGLDSCCMACWPCCGNPCSKCCDDFKCCGTYDVHSVLNETFHLHGPRGESMEDKAKGAFTVSYRRGQLFGPSWVADSGCIEGPDLDENELLLMLGFAYGTLWQDKVKPGSFPQFKGGRWLGKEQGAGRGKGEDNGFDHGVQDKE